MDKLFSCGVELFFMYMIGSYSKDCFNLETFYIAETLISNMRLEKAILQFTWKYKITEDCASLKDWEKDWDKSRNFTLSSSTTERRYPR